MLRVPVTMSVATGEQLVAAGIDQISSLQFTTPGFYTDNGVGYTQIYLRGIGNNIFVGADPSVLTNIDDVPRIYGSMVNNFVNVDRIEVLKGAQGGLYGRNATGGVVNIITRQPGDTRGGRCAPLLWHEEYAYRLRCTPTCPSMTSSAGTLRSSGIRMITT